MLTFFQVSVKPDNNVEQEAIDRPSEACEGVSKSFRTGRLERELQMV
jgi:hypothetical protein